MQEGTRRCALITGASRGIGHAIAQAMAAAGYHLVLICASNIDSLCATAQAWQQTYGIQALAIQANVADAAQVENAVKRALETFGSVDVLVNNAGITRDGMMMRMSEEDWESVLDTNLKGAFLCMQQVSRTMLRKRWGRIINMTSVVGILGNAGQCNYAASKAGLIGLTKSAAREFASRGITVNAIAPGWIQTDMTEALGEREAEAWKSRIPLGRVGSPEDVAAAVLFLAGESAGYITGQVLNVDGGMGM